MIAITVSQIASVISAASANGSRPFSLVYKTEKKLLKKDRVTKEANVIPYVLKVSEASCFLNVNYEASVNRQQVKEGASEGTFEVQQNWFEHTNIKGIVQSKKDVSKKYLQLKLEKSMATIYELPTGELIDKAVIENLLPAESKPSNQGTEKAILSFTIGIDNILSFKVDKNEYTVV